MIFSIKPLNLYLDEIVVLFLKRKKFIAKNNGTFYVTRRFPNGQGTEVRSMTLPIDCYKWNIKQNYKKTCRPVVEKVDSPDYME